MRVSKQVKWGRIFRKRKKGIEYPTWHIRYSVNNVRHEESSHSKKWEDAKRLLDKRHGEVAQGKRVRLSSQFQATVADILQLVLDDYRDNGKANFSSVAASIRMHLGPSLGNKKVETLSTAEIKAYRSARLKDGKRRSEKSEPRPLSTTTINRELEILRRAYSLAMRQEPQLVTRIPYIPMFPENNIRTGFIDDHQYRALLAELPAHLRPLLIIGYQYGTRRGNLLALRWDQVDLSCDRPTITIHPGTTKNKKGIVLPLFGDALEALRQLRQQWPNSVMVFGDENGQPIVEFRKAWASACTRAGIPKLLFHDLRRSAVRNMLQKGVMKEVAMKITGHLTTSMLDRYNIVSPADLEQMVQKMAPMSMKSTPARLESVGTDVKGTPRRQTRPFQVQKGGEKGGENGGT